MRTCLLLSSIAMLVSSLAIAEFKYPETTPAAELAETKKIIELIKGNVTVSRDAHAKNHGCVDDVKVTVSDDLPAELSLGLFEKGKRYENAIVRFSPGPGDPNADDRDGGAQGFALKILLDEADRAKLAPVPGEQRFLDDKYYETFDILTISPMREFFVETVADYRPFFAASAAAGAAAKAEAAKLAAEGKSPAEIKKGAALAAAKVLKEKYIDPPETPGLPAEVAKIVNKKRPREGAILATLGAFRPKNVLLGTYGSGVPSLYGEKAVKYRITPCEPANAETYEVPEGIDATSDRNFLARVLEHELSRKEHCFHLQVQFLTDEMKTKGVSVEDGAAHWDEELSPYRTVARIDIPRKEKGEELLPDDFCETASFHPGHATAEHFPVGGIQRARVGGVGEDGEVYEGIYTVIARQRNLNRRKPKP